MPSSERMRSRKARSVSLSDLGAELGLLRLGKEPDVELDVPGLGERLDDLDDGLVLVDAGARLVPELTEPRDEEEVREDLLDHASSPGARRA